MKKFFVLSIGFEMPTDAIMQAWGKWFQSIGSHMVDGGSPLGPGREITPTGSRDLPLGKDSTTGYMIISAESLDEAEQLMKTCPIITAMRVYEAMSH